ncbi:MAG: NAD(P)H-dependent oxidoreductase [Clostridiales bacterium]|nr:NAD(P)H-dependent oxidoreductase [Clostridiales bacterium]
MSKTLVAYFSCSGVTEDAAKRLAAAANADLYKIEPKTPYTDADLDWNDRNSRSSVEMRDFAFRPEIAGGVHNMASYDTVFIGFPIWWYVAPNIIKTFLESYDFTGKTLVCFATSGSTGIEKADAVLHAFIKGLKWKTGKLLNAMSDADIKDWVKELGL